MIQHWYLVWMITVTSPFYWYHTVTWSLTYLKVVMGDRLNFIIDHRLESVNAFDAILPIIIGSHIFTEFSTFYAQEGNSGASVFFFLCSCVKGNNWFSYITLGKTYCQSSRRLSVSETSLPCCLVVHINHVIECFVQASDDRLLKMRINHHN